MAKPVSPLTKDFSRVKTTGDLFRDDFLQAWQDMHSKAGKGNGSAGETIRYGMDGVSFVGTGTPISIVGSGQLNQMSSSESSSTPSTGSGGTFDEDEIEDDDGGFFEGVGDWFKDRWNDIKDNMKEIIMAVFGTLIAFLLFYVGILIGGSFVSNISERLQQLRTGEMTKREAMARFIKFDIFKFGNETLQRKIFGDTFSKLKNLDDPAGAKEKLGRLAAKVVNFNVIDTVFNKPGQKLVLGVTLDSLRNNAENFKESYSVVGSGSRMRVHTDKVRDFTDNRRAHVFDMIVKYDIFTAMDESIQSTININKSKSKEENNVSGKQEFVKRTFNEIIKDHDSYLNTKEEVEEKANTAHDQKDRASTSNTAKDASEQNEEQLERDREFREQTEENRQDHDEKTTTV